MRPLTMLLLALLAADPSGEGGRRKAGHTASPAELRQACADEIEQFCKGVKASRLAKCLRKHLYQLGSHCTDELESLPR